MNINFMLIKCNVIYYGTEHKNTKYNTFNLLSIMKQLRETEKGATLLLQDARTEVLAANSGKIFTYNRKYISDNNLY